MPPIRILYLENDPNDVLLFEEFLRQDALEYQLTVTTGREDYAKHLQRESFDIVIADYHLHDIDGFGAIELAQTYSSDTPLILFTGSVGEDVAVECVRKGAFDYITKQNPRRLGASIMQAIEKARMLRRQKEISEALIRSEREAQRARVEAEHTRERLAMIFESMSDGIVSFDAEMNYTFVNHRGAELLGRTPEDLVGKNYWREYPEAKGTPFANAYVRVLETQETTTLEDYYEPFDRWFENRIYPSRDGIVIFFTDITERKKREELLREESQKNVRLIETSPVGIVRIDKSGQIIFANTQAEQTLGLQPEQIAGRTYDDPAWRAETLDGEPLPSDRFPFVIVRETLQPVFDVQHAIAYPDGTRVLLSVNASPMLDAEGNFDGMVATIEDITERIRAENELHRQRALLEETQERASLGSFELDLKTGYGTWSKEMFRLFSYDASKGTPSFEQFMMFVHPDDREALRKTQASAIDSHEKVSFDFRTNPQRGAVRYVNSTIQAIRNQYGVPVKIIGSVLDVTERKKMETSLLESEALWRSYVRNAPNVIFTIDRDYKITFMNFTLPGYSLEDVIGVSLFRYLPEESRASARETLEKAFQTGERQTFEHQGYGAHGELAWYATNVGSTKQDGNVVSLILISTDISERKRSEAIVAERERQLSTLLGNLPGLAYRCRNDANFTTEFVSDGVAAITGFPAVDFREHRREFGQLIHPDDQAQVAAEVQAALKEDRPFELTYRILHASGEEKWVWERGTGIKNDSGELEVLEGFVTDITERKQMEEKLAEKQKFLEIITGATPDIVYLYDPRQQRHIYINRELENLLGYSNEEIIQAGTDIIVKSIHPQDLPRVMSHVGILASAQDDLFHELEYRIKGRDVGYLWFYVREKVYLRNDAGQPELLFGIVQDITERKRVEKALHESERRFRALIENISDAIELVDIEARVLYCSPSIQTVLGYHPDERVGRSGLDEIHPDDLNDAMKSLTLLLQSPGQRIPVVYRERHKDGSWRWLEGTATNFLDDPAVRAIVVNYRDITKRKRAEQALKESEEKFFTAFHGSPVALGITSPEGKFVEVNRAFCEMIGYDHEEVVGSSSIELGLLNAEAREKIMQNMKERGALTQYETDLRVRDGSLRTVMFSMSNVTLGGVPHRLATGFDITERRRAEEALRQSENRHRIFSEMTSDFIYVFRVEPDGKVVSDWISDSIYRVIGYSPEKYRSLDNAFQTIHPDDRELTQQMLAKVLAGEKVMYEARTVTESGDARWLQNWIQPLWDDKHQRVVAFYGAGKDITERKQVEEDLRLSEERFRTALRNSPIVVFN